MSADNKIHVAFGFHVNCYHSYRGDTPDGMGFGSDIRIIRQIIKRLNELNKSGIPVKGTWDSENFFSLEKILPEYAPDIIEGMKERVEKYGDENIIMGYSNGALGAMTEEELEYSIEKAVSNAQGSGLKDIFGKCEMIVRPQEVMFTPSQVSVYNKLGVKALCLYYSCVPFDAFRTVIPPLPDEQAFNPLIYTYKGEEITVIPTYNNSDICDAGCLRAWVKSLRSGQLSGKIQKDLFLFVNMDADAIFWESMNIPVVGSRIANTDGIYGLVKEIADLDYIVFDTPGGYISNHAPVGRIEFTQDVADGNFTGYASWGEKPYNRKIWTAVDRSRALSKVNSLKESEAVSFEERIQLLSTTHFGLATPVLNIEREKTADRLAESIVSAEKEALPAGKKITVFNPAKQNLLSVQFKVKDIDDISTLRLKGKQLESYAAVFADKDNNIMSAVLKFKSINDSYEIEADIGEKILCEEITELKTDRFSISFDENGIDSVVSDGVKIGGRDFLRSFITYDNSRFNFDAPSVSPVPCAGGKCIRLSGQIHLPFEVKAGEYEYDFFTFEGSDAVFVKMGVTYPYTAESDSISTENSALGRFTDMKWTEAVPFEITPYLGRNLSVVKRNFMDDVSSFRVDSFGEYDPKNKSLASFNHQLTGGFTGLTNGRNGIAIANAKQVLGSMAHLPMRLDKDGTVHMNPYGHYYGKQRHHWGRGRDEILGVYTLVTPQGKSIAPAYNGVSETAFIALAPLSGDMPDESILNQLCGFADGGVLSAPENAFISAFYGDNVTINKAKATGEDGTKLRNPVFSGIKGNIPSYVTKGSKAIFHIIKSQIKASIQR